MNTEIYLGLGGNLGDPPATFQQALELVGRFAEVTKVSKLYKSKPYGFVDQPDFYNAAAQLSSNLSPLDLLARLQEVEKQLGKKVVRENGPRVIDLDLLVYGDEVINLPELTLPHTGILNRDFVLKPLTDLNPMLTHPAWNGQTLQSAMEQLKECFLIEVAETI
ncbi:MAG: 2-amino-4-hydroxy-6-hydroxymethyldihydropteridine diphosphokinase [Opitutales bacterium]